MRGIDFVEAGTGPSVLFVRWSHSTYTIAVGAVVVLAFLLGFLILIDVLPFFWDRFRARGCLRR